MRAAILLGLDLVLLLPPRFLFEKENEEHGGIAGPELHRHLGAMRKLPVILALAALPAFRLLAKSGENGTPGEPWDLLQWFEFMSYVVTVVALPFAIVVFSWEQRRERQNEEEEIYQRLSDEYSNFLKLVLDNADLQLLRRGVAEVKLTEEQEERKFALFNILVSLFERSYLLVYEDDMSKQTRRLWLSWEDYMREWCRRPDFRAALPSLLQGEDEDFQRLIGGIAEKEAAKRG